MAPAMISALTSCCKKVLRRMAAMMRAMNAMPQSPPEISTHWPVKKGLSQNDAIGGTARLTAAATNALLRLKE